MSYYLNYAHDAVLGQLSSFSRTIILTALKQLAHGQLTVITEDGEAGSKPETFVFGTGEPKAEITVKSKNVWTRLCVNLDLGSAEAYMLRELECNDPVKLIQIYTANWTALSGGSFVLQILPKLQRLLLKPTNDERVALENAKSHYDTSNTMFSLFLSADMSYSCALWKTATETKGGEAEESLDDAQMRKVHNIIDKARIRKEHHVLDIGGGWAFLAIEAVKKTGCKVTVSTLSVEQKALGEKRVKDEGLEDRIEIILCDYRKTPMPEGGYDRIVSVEMIEHVGKEFMDTYFSTINSLLNPTTGIMVTQGITLINQIHENPSPMDNFLDRYIFPGGYLPSIHRVLDSVNVGSKGALEIETVQSIGPHYVKTLRSWRENFLKNWVAIREDFEKGRGDKELTEGEVEAWRRRWVYYFSYCEAAFRAGVIGDHVVVARRRPCIEEGDGIPM